MTETNLTKSANSLTRTPLGIIGLFVLLVESIAALLLGFNSAIPAPLQYGLGGFIILFPVLMLFVFRDLIINHNHKLYSPSEFQDGTQFLTANRIDPVRLGEVQEQELRTIIDQLKQDDSKNPVEELQNTISEFQTATFIAEKKLSPSQIDALRKAKGKSAEEALKEIPDLREAVEKAVEQAGTEMPNVKSAMGKAFVFVGATAAGVGISTVGPAASRVVEILLKLF